MAPPTRPAQGGGLRRCFGVFSDARAWTSLFFMLLALVTGIFPIAVTGLATGGGLLLGALAGLAGELGLHVPGMTHSGLHLFGLEGGAAGVIGALLAAVLGVLALTLTMHVARAIGRGHARLAKALLVMA